MKKMSTKEFEKINDFAERVERYHEAHEIYTSERDLVIKMYDRREGRGDFLLTIDQSSFHIPINETLGAEIRALAAAAIRDAVEREKAMFKLQKEKIEEDLGRIEKSVESL